MTEYIAMTIMKEYTKGIEAAQAKYRAYFIKHSLYKNYKQGVDKILTKNGYGNCIVTA